MLNSPKGHTEKHYLGQAVLREWVVFGKVMMFFFAMEQIVLVASCLSRNELSLIAPGRVFLVASCLDFLPCSLPR